MSEMITSEGIPEVQLGTVVKASDVPATPSFSGKWEDMAKDMAALQAEIKPQPSQPEQPQAIQPAPAPVTAPVASEPKPVAAVAPSEAASPVAPVESPKVEIPEKFRGPDGKLDQEKLLKSYTEAEKGLKRLQNQANGQAPHQQAPLPVQPPQAVPGQLTQFEAQVAQDMLDQAASLGQVMPQAYAVAQARVMVKMMEAKHEADKAATFSKVAQFEQTLEENKRLEELQSLARTNPWVLTPKGQEELVKVREENPWINTSPEPWKAATMYLLGQKSLVGALPGAVGQVLTPTPMGTQQTAQPLPVVPAQRSPNAVPLNTKAEIEAYVKTLSPEQEAGFWKSMGMRWDAPKQFVGW